MGKQLIERIAPLVQAALEQDYLFPAQGGRKSLAESITALVIARIDAERWKEAVGYDALFNAIADATNADAGAVTISVRLFEASMGGKLFLSPTIPEEVSYHNAPGCLNTGDKAMWTIGWNACRDAMLAATGELGLKNE